MNKRTWMKVTDPTGHVMWVGIEADAIVQLRWPDARDGEVDRTSVRMRADDTLSRWAGQGDKIEGPFDAPV